jgi:hypothetical protein
LVARLVKRYVKQVSRRPFGYLDSPFENQLVSGSLYVEGWVIDPTGPCGDIELMVDGRRLENSVQRKPRPDVEAAFPDNRGQRETTGFIATVETSQFPEGHHRLSCVVRKFGTARVVARRAIQTRSCTRSMLAYRYLQGSGLEIGALHNPQAVPSGCRVTYVDRMNIHDLRRHYPELAGKPLADVGVIDDGEKLLRFGESSQDFIIANHFLEHTQDPIGTIKRHLEVLKPEGILFMAVPDKRQTFDVKRPVTPLEHLYRDYREGPAWSYMDHVREWVSLVGDMRGELFEEQVRRVVDTQYSIHFHVWTQNELLEFLVDIRQRLALPFDIVAIVQDGAESILVLKKRNVP